MTTFEYEYPRPAVAVDAVVFGVDQGELQVLLVQRGVEPFGGRWALPGGFVRMDEGLDAAVVRELHEEAGVVDVYLEQVGAFGRVDRDPRGRVISVAYYALTKLADHEVTAATDARDAAWFSIAELPALPFDHDEIVQAALQRLRHRIQTEPIGFELLPTRFSLTQLQRVYEAVLDRPIDKRNFRKKLTGMEVLVATQEYEKDVAHRAARLYRFDERRYRRLVREGFDFNL